MIRSCDSSRPDLPATFESLNDDILTTVLDFVGRRSYRSFGGTNKHCKEIYLTSKGMTKNTFVYGYAPLACVIDRIKSVEKYNQELQESGVGEIVVYNRNKMLQESVGKGVVLYNRRDVLVWALEERKMNLLGRICEVATEECRINLLEEVFNAVEDWGEKKEHVFGSVEKYAANRGKLNVLMWFEQKGLSIHKVDCAEEAAHGGQLHILEWLREERGLELFEDLYCSAIAGNQLDVMKWLREQEVPWDDYTFACAAEEGNVMILQWLQIEDCPWDPNIRVSQSLLNDDVIQLLLVIGHGDKFERPLSFF